MQLFDKNLAEITPNQSESIEKYQIYLKQKKVPELFNKLLTRIIHDKPKNVKQHIIEQLIELKKQEKDSNLIPAQYLNSEDFETMFDAYDIAGEGNVNYSVLVHALSVAGVADPQEAVAQDFPEVKPSSLIGRAQFSHIMVAEFNKRGYS